MTTEAHSEALEDLLDATAAQLKAERERANRAERLADVLANAVLLISRHNERLATRATEAERATGDEIDSVQVALARMAELEVLVRAGHVELVAAQELHATTRAALAEARDVLRWIWNHVTVPDHYRDWDAVERRLTAYFDRPTDDDA